MLHEKFVSDGRGLVAIFQNLSEIILSKPITNNILFCYAAFENVAVLHLLKTDGFKSYINRFSFGFIEKLVA